jgi:hypothetical protein
MRRKNWLLSAPLQIWRFAAQFAQNRPEIAEECELATVQIYGGRCNRCEVEWRRNAVGDSDRRSLAAQNIELSAAAIRCPSRSAR